MVWQRSEEDDEGKDDGSGCHVKIRCTSGESQSELDVGCKTCQCFNLDLIRARLCLDKKFFSATFLGKRDIPFVIEI